MNIETGTIRLLGAAQLAVFLASMLSERLLASAVGSGNASEKLLSISNNLTRVRISNFVGLIDSLAIVVLGVLFYSVFNEQYKIIALIALGWFLAEAITLAVGKMGSYAMIPLSREFVEAGAPEASYFQRMADLLYHGVDRLGYDIHMLFFCMGGILWYSLFFRSGYIPPALALWGLVSVCLLTVPSLLVLYKREPSRLMLLALPYAPYEFVLGLWLIVKGFN